jgi:hypothetical protein
MVRFAIDGGAYPTVNITKLAPFASSSSTPEPGTAASVGLGVAALGVLRRRRRRDAWQA